MNPVYIEIECPNCGRRMSFWLNTRTDEINLEEETCAACGNKILASLEFEEV